MITLFLAATGLLNSQNSEGGRITYWFDLLSLQDLLVRNQLHLFSNNLV